MDRKTFYTTEKLSEHIEETPEGFLVCYDVPIARIGQYVYKSNEVPIEADSSGLVKIQRDEDEVFAETALQSFSGKPITINHPDEFVTPENWKTLAHGHLQNVRRGEGEKSDLAIADLLITTEDAIKLIKAGLREVSCGYDAEYEQLKPGLGKQKNITGNHVALVVKGRAGSRCAIMDTACSCCGNCTCQNNKCKKEDKGKMEKKVTVKDVLSRVFPRLKNTLATVKDEDLVFGEGEESTEGSSDLQAAQEAAAKAKEAAIQAVEAAKKASEVAAEMEANKSMPVEEDEEPEENFENEQDPIQMIMEKIDALDSKLQMLLDALEGDEEVNEENPTEEEIPEEEEAPSEEEEIPEEEMQQDEDEIPEEEFPEEEDEKNKTTDSIWQNVVSRADILAPGIVVSKPQATNFKKVTSAVKRKALSIGMTKDHASLIKPLLGNKKIKNLNGETLDTIFTAASEMIKKVNDAKVQSKTMQMKDLSCHNELASINQRNKEFWNKK